MRLSEGGKGEEKINGKEVRWVIYVYHFPKGRATIMDHKHALIFLNLKSIYIKYFR